MVDPLETSIDNDIVIMSTDHRFIIQIVGYTVQHKKTGTVGIGRQPWKTLEEAQNWLYGR